MSTLPPIVMPVRRAGLFRDQSLSHYRRDPPEPHELVQPFLTVDFLHGSSNQIREVIIKLIHGANYNDPQRFFSRNYNQLKSSRFLSSTSFGKFGMEMNTVRRR
jgi:cyanobactin biosynthesis protein (PatB/AcyB/McaB family)